LPRGSQKSDKNVQALPPGGSGIVGQGSKIRLILGSIRSTLRTVHILECGDEHRGGRPRDRPAVGSLAELVVAGRERSEGQVELAMARGEVLDARRADAAWREVIVWQGHPGRGVGQIGDEPAVQLVEGIAQALQVGVTGLGREVDVLRA